MRFRWISDVEAKAPNVNVAMSPQEESTKNRLGENVEDTVEDSLGVRGDDIASLTDTPGDGVEEPQANGPATADSEDLVNILTESAGVLQVCKQAIPEED